VREEIHSTSIEPQQPGAIFEDVPNIFFPNIFFPNIFLQIAKPRQAYTAFGGPGVVGAEMRDSK